MSSTTVHELRLVVTVPDFDEAVHRYREVLGMPDIAEDVVSDQGRIVILDAGRATLELADAAHAAYVDEVEVGRGVDDGVRVALAVEDVDGATRAVARTGAEVLASPRPTPWGSRNARLTDPSGLQLTLFSPSHDVPPTRQE